MTVVSGLILPYNRDEHAFAAKFSVYCSELRNLHCPEYNRASLNCGGIWGKLRHVRL